jgi:predicted aldo/keto reductase-like oxidoreductase
MADQLRVTPGRLIFGTMRLSEVERSIEDWVDFFQNVYAMGITSLHSSSEYDTFPLLCEILRELAKADNSPKFRHAVKLAEPSFDDSGFDAARLAEKVAGYCAAFGVSCIHDVQWMWRHNLSNDGDRIDAFKRKLPTLTDAVESLKSQGKIERFFCFPYSPAFANEALRAAVVDGLTVYRNAQETEYDAAIGDCAEFGKRVLVIRPLNAGKVLEKSAMSAAENVRYSLDLPAITAGIISSNNLDHIRELLVS